MPIPSLLIDGSDEFPLDQRITSIGRAPDNSLSLPDDSNISRYHAEIERRGEDEFWLFDLNSSNGTTLNGEPVVVEKPLYDRDVIQLGGSCTLEVVLSEREPAGETEAAGDDPEEEDVTKEEPAQEEAPTAPEKSGIPLLMIIAGLAIGLAVISVAVVAVVLYTGGGLSGSCEAQAAIVKPQNGDILNELTQIEIELTDPTGCVTQAVFLIDDEQVAASETPPFSATIDPSRFPGLADGLDHFMKVVLIDGEGKPIPQPSEIALNFDTLETETPTPSPGGEGGPNTPGGQNTRDSQSTGSVTLTDTKTMTERILPQFSGSARYVTGNPQFLETVSRLTPEYAVEGYFQRAARYRDVINTEFIQERGLDPPLGYILAMSRSKFVPVNDKDGAGLWRMNNDLVLEHRYNGLCGSETIANQTQNCASIASSNYVKDILLKVFDGNSGDIIYVVAAFGMSPLEAAAWKESLPADRSDFWRVLERDPQKREEVARFFAAAIVAENPQRFGLRNDRPLSELYRDFMK